MSAMWSRRVLIGRLFLCSTCSLDTVAEDSRTMTAAVFHPKKMDEIQLSYDLLTINL